MPSSMKGRGVESKGNKSKRYVRFGKRCRARGRVVVRSLFGVRLRRYRHRYRQRVKVIMGKRPRRVGVRRWRGGDRVLLLLVRRVAISRCLKCARSADAWEADAAAAATATAATAATTAIDADAGG